MNSPEADDFHDPYDDLDASELESLEQVAEDEQADLDYEQQRIDDLLDHIVDTQNISYAEARLRAGIKPLSQDMVNPIPVTEVVLPLYPKTRRRKATKPNLSRITNFVEVPEGPSLDMADAVESFGTIMDYYNKANRRLGQLARNNADIYRKYSFDADDVVTGMSRNVDIAARKADVAFETLTGTEQLAEAGTSGVEIQDYRVAIRSLLNRKYGPRDPNGSRPQIYAKTRHQAVGNLRTTLNKAQKRRTDSAS